MKKIDFILECTRDGNIRHFNGYYHERESPSIRFVIEDDEHGHDQQTQGFIIDFSVIPFDDNSMQIKIMDIHLEEYRAIGIPDAIIIKAKELLGKNIVSSSNSHLHTFGTSMEGISPHAEKVWERLVLNGLAMFNNQLDRYITL